MEKLIMAFNPSETKVRARKSLKALVDMTIASGAMAASDKGETDFSLPAMTVDFPAGKTVDRSIIEEVLNEWRSKDWCITRTKDVEHNPLKIDFYVFKASLLDQSYSEKQQALTDLKEALELASNTGLLDDLAAELHPDTINQFCDRVSDFDLKAFYKACNKNIDNE